MVDHDKGVVRLARITETVLTVGHTSRHAAIRVFMPATELKKDEVPFHFLPLSPVGSQRFEVVEHNFDPAASGSLPYRCSIDARACNSTSLGVCLSTSAHVGVLGSSGRSKDSMCQL
jgi:hypothetical protein